MKLINTLRAEHRAAAQKAADLLKEITTECQKANNGEGREMTDEERGRIQAEVDQAKALHARIARAEGDQAIEDEVRQMSGLTSGRQDSQAREVNGVVRPTDEQIETFGAQFTGNDSFLQFAGNPHRGRFSTGAVPMKGETITTGGASAGALITPDRRSDIVRLLFQRLTVADLLGSGRTNSTSIIVPTESLLTNAAAAIAEGDIKPESTIRFSGVTEAVKKLATVLKISDEALDDIPYIRSYIDGRGRFFVEQHEEVQLLNGDGLGNNLLGLRNRVGLTAAQAVGADTGFDAIHKQITKITLNSWLTPDGIVMHPNDWEQLALTKDTTGRYIGAGPFEAMQTKTLWGLPVVATTAMTEGTAFIGAYRAAAAVIRRTDGITVEMTNSNEDDFIRNLVALRFEERLALAVYRPGAFGAVTGL